MCNKFVVQTLNGNQIKSNILFLITIHNVFFFVDSKSCISVCIQINVHMNSLPLNDR